MTTLSQRQNKSLCLYQITEAKGLYDKEFTHGLNVKHKIRSFFNKYKSFLVCVSNSLLQSKRFLDNQRVMLDSSSLYPLFVSLKQKHCLIVGLGAVGARKLETLIAHDTASICVVEKRPSDALAEHVQQMLKASNVYYYERCFVPDDLLGKFLVIAATNSASVNQEIACLCRTQNILCNSITNPTEGDTFLPAIASAQHLSLALSTSGASPALARRWRQELQTWIAQRERMVTLMARLRPHILALQKTPEENTHLFHSIVDSPIQEWLALGKCELCKQKLIQILPAQLHALVTELFDDLA